MLYGNYPRESGDLLLRMENITGFIARQNFIVYDERKIKKLRKKIDETCSIFLDFNSLNNGESNDKI